MLESKHPNTRYSQFLYTHECRDNEIAYFKVDYNHIGDDPDAFTGTVFNFHLLNWTSS